jgi:catechol 2,3-dioxygenase-like lactoylglutathione lyase family enzyme
MDPRLHFLTLATPDLDAARSFYRDGLGWTPTIDVPGEILFFQVAPGLMLGLFDSAKFDEDTGTPREMTGVSGVTLSHNVDSRAAVLQTIDKMVDAGATLTKEAQDGAFGEIFHAQISDPNGVVWEIAHNPGWRIDERGIVTFGID